MHVGMDTYRSAFFDAYVSEVPRRESLNGIEGNKWQLSLRESPKRESNIQWQQKSNNSGKKPPLNYVASSQSIRQFWAWMMTLFS